MSKRSDPAAFARAVGAADPVTFTEPVPAPDVMPLPKAANALALPPQGTELSDDAPPENYDPAAYRWVPVRRRPRVDGWTEEKQRRFIETLADTGLVNVAARAVGMSRASAYQLRRAAHGAAFARAWDAARHHAGGLIEDIAFERAIEGTEQEVLNREGELIATRLVHDNGLLKWLLSHLKPERYGSARSPAQAHQATAEPVLEDSLRAMEPALPAPPERLLDPETFAHELDLADQADGILPQFLSEQRRPKSDAGRAAEEAAARDARGAAALAKQQAGGLLTGEEFADQCYHLDPVSNARPRCRRRQWMCANAAREQCQRGVNFSTDVRGFAKNWGDSLPNHRNFTPPATRTRDIGNSILHPRIGFMPPPRFPNPRRCGKTALMPNEAASLPPDPLDELDRLLLDLDDDDVMLLSQVDGLIAAVLVAPGPLDEAVWLPAIWGGGEGPFDPPERARLRALTMARKAEVVGELLRGDMAYDPIYDVDPNDDLPFWEPWIDGFGAGVALAGEAWLALVDHPDEDLGAAALGLSALVALADDPRRNPDLAGQAPDLIPYLVETLYRRQRGMPRVILDPSAARLPGLG